MNRQTPEFFLAILNDVRTAIFFFPWFKGGWHDVALLFLAVSLVSHAHRATLPLPHPLLQVRVAHFLNIILEQTALVERKNTFWSVNSEETNCCKIDGN